MYKLVYKEGEKTNSYPVEKSDVSIGRASDNDIIINDFGVSRHHARITIGNSECFIVDLNSRNGTRVNNVLVTRGDLHDGDEINLGKFNIRFTSTTDDRVHLEETGDNLLSPGTFIKPISEIEKIIPDIHPQIQAQPPALSDIQKSNEILGVLIRVAKSLLTVQPLNEVLNLVMDLIFEHLNAERGFLMLYDEHSGDLIPKVVKYRDPQADAGKITISKTITNKVFSDKVAILTSDALFDPRFDGGASIIFHNIRSAMCAPLWNKDEVIGVVFIDSTTKTGTFNPGDLDLLTALANYAAIGIEQARLNEKIKEEVKRRSQLERYHSPSVINRILNSAETDIEAQEVETTVVFSDIVGFTGMSEKMEPHRVALLLNEYFGEMTDVIFKYEGTLDKFIGDAIMAVFGAPLPMEDHAVRAVKASLEMREKLEEFNDEKFGIQRINVRIGINSGPVVAGDIG
ncbi:MAG TPA: adenylate/guanylate cyclase domain-containing protein, partial [Acidobacteriota bacterium]|nr:adenylate/guanylate cyclase domain-containing protein [Acidobacteriota bacterium]